MFINSAIEFSNNYQLLKSAHFDHSQADVTKSQSNNKTKSKFYKPHKSQMQQAQVTLSLEQMLSKLTQKQESEYEINTQWSIKNKSPPQKSVSKSKINLIDQSTNTEKYISPVKLFNVEASPEHHNSLQYIKMASKTNKYFKEIYDYQSRKK